VDLNLPEALLRLACYDVAQYTITSQDEEFVQLNFRAKGEVKQCDDWHKSALVYTAWCVCVQ